MSGLFRVDGAAVDALAFRHAAIDPAASVVVDACAGSGKTTLLVARIVRALLEGAEPDQVLAVTFTRLAAHEMRERLSGELRSLALADDASLHARLRDDFGLGAARADALADRARGLYEAVLRHPRGPEITTFHRWFRTLALMGPLSTDSGEGTQLTEEAASLIQQAWFAWLDALRGPDRAGLCADFETLVAAVGLAAVRRCLESMVDQRTDWAVALGVDPDAPPARLQVAAARAAADYRAQWCEAARAFAATAGLDSDEALLGALATDRALRDDLAHFGALLSRAGADVQRLGLRLADLAGTVPPDATATRAWLAGLADAVLTREGAARKWRTSKALTALLEASGGADPALERWAAFAQRVATARALVDEWRGVALNAAMMRCGADLLGRLRETKRAQGVIDFADLESIAYRMLRDPGTAAYVQCRMDRRYRHLLFDEFQDTSSLQWRVIADWLQSYAGAGERPSVFVVGDPKQSIYRFRRAEARVFDAAKLLLREGFAAREAGTDTTRRNAPAIVAALNRCLPPTMPHYRHQATLAGACEGLFWRLPLVAAEPGADADGEAADAPFDWLASTRDDEASLRHREGLLIADAIELARAELARQGRPVRYGSVYILARSRTGFEAYERALRERGLPVQSDRAGGLLRTLEGDDLRALLGFARRPSDDLALAQVLASPLVGLDGDAIAWIAARGPAPVGRQAEHGAVAGVDRDDAIADGDPGPFGEDAAGGRYASGGEYASGDEYASDDEYASGNEYASGDEYASGVEDVSGDEDVSEHDPASGDDHARAAAAAGRDDPLRAARPCEVDAADAAFADPVARDTGRRADAVPSAAAADPVPADGSAHADGPVGLPRRWWPRLRALAARPAAHDDPAPFDLAGVVARLSAWIDAAGRLPVHDFLDAVLAEVDAFARYPAAVDPAQREVAHANLCAMLGLALDVDAGRFPSLARFLRRLREFGSLDDREGPSEGRSDAVDAIRLMTIHASKGLEADLVVLADAHQRARPDGQRLHIDWAPELPRPSQLSFVLDSTLVGCARRESFDRDAALREMEDRNLLYVALTRARHGVVVSGSKSRTAPASSWYTDLDGVDPPPGWVADGTARTAGVAACAPGAPFELRLLDLPRLDIGTRREPAEGDDGATLATDLGHAMHRALELLPEGHGETAVLAALHAFALDDGQRRSALARARTVLAMPTLAPVFDPAAPAASELEILDAQGAARRIDRLVRVGDETWIVDYKWSVGPDRLPEYREQMALYRSLVARLEPPPFGATGAVRTLLVDAAAGLVAFDVDLG
jgi:ATP-dependent exoDNAse (exonuclease V) beta subunit